MYPAGFETATPGDGRRQTPTSDRAATGIGIGTHGLLITKFTFSKTL
jgi:hypothetical protein